VVAGVRVGARADSNMLALGAVARSVCAEGWVSVVCDNVANNELTHYYQMSVSDNKFPICCCENNISKAVILLRIKLELLM